MIFSENLKKRNIKASIDNLNTGVIFSKMNGVLLLANKKMYEIYDILCARTLQSSHAFWESLYVEYDNIKMIKEGASPSLMFPDGKVYNFRKKEIVINDNNMLQIEAIDMTVLYNLQQDLEEKHNTIIQINNQMLETKKALETITRDEEMLDAKLKIHNTMGAGLTSVRRYLINGEGDIDKALNTWTQSLKLLNKHDKFSDYNELESLKNAAESVGIEIVTTGTWPTSKKIVKTIIWVARESIINAAVHAQATKLFINIDGTELEYIIRFTNDGDKPKEKLKYGGGFSSIKNAVDEVGGKYIVSTKDGFVLDIYLPRI